MGLLATLSATGAVANAPFIDLRRIEPIHGDATIGAKAATVCVGCHGAAGISPVSAFPNLAGQKAGYLYWALVAYQRGERPDSPMTAQAEKLTDQEMRGIAVYYAGLAPADAKAPADAALADRGGEVYRHGDPARGIPPCQGCHGAEARGHPLASGAPRYGIYPSLRGQHADYLVQRLKDFSAGKYTLTSNDRIMHGIAGRLDEDTMRALATWLSAAPAPASR